MTGQRYFVHSDTDPDEEHWPPCSCGERYGTREQAMAEAAECLDLDPTAGVGAKFWTAAVTETDPFLPKLPTCADDLVDHMGDLMSDELSEETIERVYQKVTTAAKDELDTMLAFIWEAWVRKHGVHPEGPMLSISEQKMHVLTTEGIK
jgi:hypothetical protein